MEIAADDARDRKAEVRLAARREAHTAAVDNDRGSADFLIVE
jgi:hypothetical protein